MKPFVPLTELAQQAVGESLEPGALAIDATVGNGHDTLFLAGRVAPGGRVIGFDIQPRAIEGTRARLASAGLGSAATLKLCGHEHMLEQVPDAWSGKVSAVMFNLGYLPGGDKTRITQAETTISALDQALALLSIGGLISLLLYRGHAGAETDAVLGWLDQLGPRYRIRSQDSPGPLLYLIERLR
ncbi:MAG: class I SAM-dependent methyltransferase [Sedimenticolaceae bacterium]|jgi:methylase of polypeptide subunit release factors